jgi:hypothetical protein
LKSVNRESFYKHRVTVALLAIAEA